MIINEIDQSALSDATHRTLLLQKLNENQSKQQPTSKQKIYQIIRDKSFCEIIDNNQTFTRNLRSFYKKFNLIRPQNPFIVVWNVLNIFVILYFIMQLPLIFGYGEVVWIDQYTVLLPLIIIFILILIADIFLTPLKMIYKQGLLIRDRQILFKRYMGRNFWFDLVGLLSIIFPLILKQYYYANLVKILFLGKIVILNNLNDKIVGVLVFRIKTKTIYLIGRLVVFIILIAHYLGIGFFMVSYYVYYTNMYGPNTPNICWIYNAQAYYQIIVLLDWKGQYLYTMYFSIGMTTTIAYGDITPLNPTETIYIIIALIINTLAFGYILSQVLRILIQAFYSDFTKNNIRYTMQNILVGRKINPKLRQLIRSHMEQISKQQMFRDREVQRQVIGTLPFNLQITLYGKIYGEFFQTLKLSPQPFYIDKNRNTRFLQSILLQITEARYLIGDLIYKQNQFFSQQLNNHRCYFLKDQSQKSDIILGVGRSPVINIQNHQIIDQHSYMIFKNDRPLFGQVQFMTGNIRSHWLMSKNNILLYQMPRKALLDALRYAGLKQIQYLTQYKQKIENSYCYICYEQHNFKKCQKANYIPNILQSVKKINQKEKMKRKYNTKILDTRSKRSQISLKCNALRNYKNFIDQKQKKSLAKSQLRMLAHSKHYRKIYQEDEQCDSSSITSSETSEEDLDYLINQTRALISNLNMVGKQDSQLYDKQFFQYDFDAYYQFKAYKPKSNYDNVLNKLADLQKILKSKTKISFTMNKLIL